MHLTLCPNPSVDKFLELPGLIPGKVNRSKGEQQFPGGKGVHVALALRELGINTRLIGFWGGPPGKWIREECRKKRVSTTGVEIGGWNRTCLTIKQEKNSSENETEILEKGPSIEKNNLSDFFRLLEEHMAEATSVIVSGSWPDGTPPDVYDTLKKITSNADIPLWVDASGDRLKQATQTHPYGIHINKQEAEFLFGEGESPEVYTRFLLEKCSVAALTDGANGLYLAKNDCMIHASCPVDSIISTVGSGDCLFAGLISADSTGKPPEESAKLGVACGAANCIRPELGMIHRKDVMNLLNRASARKLTGHG